MKPYYDDGAGIQIFLGDCREVLPTISGINCTMTSPPYNTLGTRVPQNGTGLMTGSAWLAKTNAHGYEDSLDEGEYQAQQVEVAKLIRQASVPGASYFYNHKLRFRDYEMLHPINLAEKFTGWQIRQELIWNRTQSMTFNARMFASSDERIIWMWRNDAPHKWYQVGAAWMTVWTISPLTADGGAHPCPYPNLIAERCILATTDEGDTILDPYCGSGTTLRAAKDLGRKAIGIENVEKWAEHTALRLAQGVLF